MEYIVVGIFLIGLIVRGFRWLLRQTNPPRTPLAPPPSQGPAPAPFQPQNPFLSQAPPRPQPGLPSQTPRPAALTPAQAFQQQQALERQARIQPRQPQAGGPAVPLETSRQDFVRQEQELFASEPAGLGVALSSPAVRSNAPANTLFGGTDDLVRAIILQEVLGPPLSRRPSPPTSRAPQAAPEHTPSS